MNQPIDVNARLKAAVRSVEPPPFLEARIRNQIRAQAPRRSWAFKLIPAAVALAICAGVIVAYQLGHLRMTVGSQEAYNGSLRSQVATIMRVGLGDHIHCAYFRKYPKNPPPVEQFIEDMGPQYSGLIPIVREQVPGNYRMELAHRCRYNGRRFVHLSLMDGNRLLSVVIARKDVGESFQTEGLLPALMQSGIPIYQSGVQSFAINAFESRDHLVYFISNLPQQQNAAMMQAMAPSVKTFLQNLEG